MKAFKKFVKEGVSTNSNYFESKTFQNECNNFDRCFNHMEDNEVTAERFFRFLNHEAQANPRNISGLIEAAKEFIKRYK